MDSLLLTECSLTNLKSIIMLYYKLVTTTSESEGLFKFETHFNRFLDSLIPRRIENVFSFILFYVPLL